MLKAQIHTVLRTLFLAFTLAFVGVSLATAAAGDPPVGIDSKVDSLLNWDPHVVGFFLGAVIPYLIAVVTGLTTPAWIKKSLAIVLSVVAGVVTVSQIEGGGAIISVATLKSAMWALVSALIVYWTTLRNSVVETKLQEIPPSLGGK